MSEPSHFRLQLSGVLRGHPWRIQHLCFSPDGNVLASTSISSVLVEGAADPTVFLWDVSSGIGGIQWEAFRLECEHSATCGLNAGSSLF